MGLLAVGFITKPINEEVFARRILRLMKSFRRVHSEVQRINKRNFEIKKSRISLKNSRTKEEEKQEATSAKLRKKVTHTIYNNRLFKNLDKKTELLLEQATPSKTGKKKKQSVVNTTKKTLNGVKASGHHTRHSVIAAGVTETANNEMVVLLRSPQPLNLPEVGLNKTKAIDLLNQGLRCHSQMNNEKALVYVSITIVPSLSCCRV